MVTAGSKVFFPVVLSLLSVKATEALVTNNIQEGCNVTLNCTGNGSSVSWKRRDHGTTIVNTSDGLTVLTTRTNGPIIMGNLTFRRVEQRNGGHYCCTVNGSFHMSIPLLVRAAVIIRPNSTEIDISSYSLGSSLEVVCHVEAACVLTEVSLWKDNSVIQSVNVTNTVRNLQFSLEVTADLPGTYQYRVVYYLRGIRKMNSSQNFIITGRALPNSNSNNSTTTEEDVNMESFCRYEVYIAATASALSVAVIVIIILVAVVILLIIKNKRRHSHNNKENKEDSALYEVMDRYVKSSNNDRTMEPNTSDIDMVNCQAYGEVGEFTKLENKV